MKVLSQEELEKSLPVEVSIEKVRDAYRAIRVNETLVVPRKDWIADSHPSTNLSMIYPKKTGIKNYRVRSDNENYYITKLKELPVKS